jgi:hypothetical protein
MFICVVPYQPIELQQQSGRRSRALSQGWAEMPGFLSLSNPFVFKRYFAASLFFRKMHSSDLAPQ